MAVDDAPLRVGGKQGAQLAQVAGNVIVLPDGQLVNTAAQGTYLIVKKARLIVMVEEIKLHLFAVDGAVYVHDERLHAAGVHGGHDLQNTDRRHHSASSWVRQSLSAACAAASSCG